MSNADSATRHRDHRRERERDSKWARTKNHGVAMCGEFIGTTLFLWFSFAGAQSASVTGGAVANTPSEVVLTSLSFGFSLLVTVWSFYRISGGLFNPAVRDPPKFIPWRLLTYSQVTLGLALTSNLPWFRAVLLLPAQLLGGIVAAALVKCMFPGPLVVDTKLSNGTTAAQGVFIEMFLTSLLVFTVLMLAAEKHYATFVAPVGIGLALFVAMIAGLPYTGSSLNPARSFGPAVALPDFPGYHYIYWFGPVMGALLAAGYYSFVKYLRYEEANPGQDAVNEREKRRETEQAEP